MNKPTRIFLFVLDSFGIGQAPDADLFGDHGADTLKSCYETTTLNLPTMRSLGLFNIENITVGEKHPSPIGAYARITEKSAGKDTTIGHWEIAGAVSENPLPVYPDGFPDEVIEKLEKATGRKIICNKPYSGTKVIVDYGKEHLETGALIVYTSADSVCQIAAHEDVVPTELLYKYCEETRKILTGVHGVGRVIARPFNGTYPDFVRTSGRHDFSLEPPKETLLDALMKKKADTLAVGKIYDIFAGRGISETVRTSGNTDGMMKTDQFFEKDFNGLCFINLVDFDMLYGHRRDAAGYANALNEFDSWLSVFMSKMHDNDIIMITADHGCDPCFKGTDHTRECTPLLVYGKNILPKDLKTRHSFADIAATVSEILKADYSADGESFAEEIIRK